MSLPSLAVAQDENVDDDVVEEIVTYGKFRASLIDSIGTKRNATSVVEAISAEDIGKLPDSSIAEAISRLPGLAGQRLDGRQSSISIRGLGENFSTATLNGREQVSIGDNRGIEFDVYPSEIMSGVTVYKTPDASLMNQGIAGTINLHTVRPLDYGRTITINAHLEQNGHDKLNPDGDDQGHRAVVSYIDNFADDTVGIALAVATMESPNQEERWNSWGFPTDNDTGDLILGGAKPFVRSSTLDRDTIMGVLQFEPTDALSITADGLYIDFSDEKRLRGIEIPGEWGPGGAIALESQNGLVTEGIFPGNRPQMRNDFERRDAELTSVGINVAYDLSDIWTVTFDASHGAVERQIWSLESYSTATGRPADNTTTLDDIGFSMGGGSLGAVFSPSLDYSDDSLVALGGAQQWGNGLTVSNQAQDGFINTPFIADELQTFKLSGEALLDFAFVTGVEFGVYYADRTKDKFDDGLFLTLPAFPNTASVPDQYRVSDVSLDFIGMGNMVAYDSFSFWQDGNYVETSERQTVSGRWQNTWTVNEEVTIAYAMAEFDTDLGNVNVTGNFGLQYVYTDQSSIGYATRIENGFVVPEPVSGGDDYNDVLPSLNVIVNLTDDQLLRFGAARTQSRSRMDRMNASFGVDFNNNPTDGVNWRANGANPGLQPQQADQFDMTYEWYFSDDGYVGAAYFYKDLKNWQVQVEEPRDFSDLTPPPGATQPVNPNGFITYWQNSEGGDISGFELQGAYQFGGLTPVLEGLGLVASATFIDSSIQVSGNEIQVPGLSEEVYNITLYYERAGFEARVSSSMREDFLGEVSAISFSRELVSVKSTEIVDAQVSYSFENSTTDWLRGLTLMVQGQNLTNEPFVTFQNNDPRQVRDYQVYERNFLIGASYRFE